MFNRNHWRGVARIAAPLSAVTLAFLISCVDAPVASAPNDEWAETAMVNTQLRIETTLFDQPGRPKVDAGVITSAVPVLRAWPSARGAAQGPVFSRSGSGRTAIRHFRHGDTLTTIGHYFDRDDAPPKFTYVFENSRIRAIVSSKYARHGRGYVRTRSRVTFFGDNGQPTSQVDVGTNLAAQADGAIGASLATAAHAVADVVQVLAPRALQAEEIPSACFSLWISYITASAVLAAASATVTAVAETCATTLLTCPAFGVASLAWAIALDKWQIALDRLTDCIANSAPPGGDVGGVTGSGSNPEPESKKPETMTVQDFINRSIDSGNYSCTASGDYCIYYAT